MDRLGLFRRLSCDDLDDLIYQGLILLGRRGLVTAADTWLLTELEYDRGLIALPLAA